MLENTSVLLARLVGFRDPDAGRDCVPRVVTRSTVVCLPAGLGTDRLIPVAAWRPLASSHPAETGTTLMLLNGDPLISRVLTTV